MTASSLAHLYFGSFSHSSGQNRSTSTSDDAKPFSGLSRDALLGSGLDSGWATPGLSQSFPEATPLFSWRYASGELSCWNVNLRPSLISGALWKMFPLRIASIFPSILTSLPVPVTEKHSHSMRLPPSCLTVCMVLMRRLSVPGFLHTRLCELWPNS